MKSTLMYILKLLNSITASSEEIYQWFAGQRLSLNERKKWGFPVHDLNHPDQVYTVSSFSSSTSPDEQVCRCGKSVSLLQEDWYVDDAGCSYHWGKKIFSNGPNSSLYSCCKKVSLQNGCMHHKYHACAYKPIGKFVQAEKRYYGKCDSSNVFALDSEMVYTAAGLEVARVTLLSLKGEVIYDLFVQPDNPILDYNTPFSGIKAEDLKGVTTTLAEAQSYLLSVLNKDSILIGHGLENDLLGLHLIHDNIVDTALIFRHEQGYPLRHSLKVLSLRYLNKVIHSNLNGHDSVEDARVCLALMLKRLYLQSLSPYFKYNFSTASSATPSVTSPSAPPVSSQSAPTVSSQSAPTVSSQSAPTVSTAPAQVNPFYYPPSVRLNYDVKSSPIMNCQTIIVPKLYQTSHMVSIGVSTIMYVPRCPFY